MSVYKCIYKPNRWDYRTGNTRTKEKPVEQSVFALVITHLVHKLQVREEGDVLCPLDCAEQKPGCQLADVLDAHQVVSLHALSPVARRGVGLGAQQQGDEAGQVRLSVIRVSAVGQVLARAALGVRSTSSLHSLENKTKNIFLPTFFQIEGKS